MSKPGFSVDTFLAWHEWVRVAALVLLILVLLYALLQLVVPGIRGHAARAWNGGSLRLRLITGLLLVGTIPALALGLLLSERSAHQRMDRLGGRLEETAVAMARSVDQFIDKHRAGISTAASTISADDDLTPERLGELLLIYHAVYSDFLTMLCAGADGKVFTASSNIGGVLGTVPAFNAHDISDRDYFRVPMTSGEQFLSRVFQGRGLGRDPIVAVSAALTNGSGEPIGIVEGSLNLRAFARLDASRGKSDDAELILVDQDQRVIYASATTGLAELASIADSPIVSGAESTSPGGRYEFRDASGVESRRYLGARTETSIGWTVYVRAPLSGITRQMGADYLLGASLLLLAFIISWLLARGIVARLGVSIGEVHKAIASFRLDGGTGIVETPPGAPTEFRPVFQQMEKSSRALRAAHRRLRGSMEAGDKLRRELTQLVSLKESEIAEQTAELEEANRRLSSLSKVDALTGIANRREFDDVSERVWRAGRRQDEAVAIVLIDIDHFKQYNDANGHQAGDACLRQVAEALSDCASRPLDLVARYGGEEFVAVLGSTNTSQALVVAERMRRAVQRLAIAHEDCPGRKVTVSLGVSSGRPKAGGSLGETVRAADEALYQAKDAGRNCVVFRLKDEFVVASGAAAGTSGPEVATLRKTGP